MEKDSNTNELIKNEIQIILKTRLAEEYVIANNIITVPSNYDSEKLNTLVKKLLKSKKDKNNKNDLNEIKMPDEIVRNVNKENLKSIDDYTLETLKNLAKKFNIPLSIKNSGKWKSLNKTEIYSEISKFLNKKNLN